MNGFVEEFDWFDEIADDGESIEAKREQMREERRHIREDIAKVFTATQPELLDNLQSRVTLALNHTQAQINSFNLRMKDAILTDSEVEWLRKANVAVGFYEQTIRRIDGRKIRLRREIKEAKRAKREPELEKRRAEEQELRARKIELGKLKAQAAMQDTAQRVALQKTEKKLRGAQNLNRSLQRDLAVARKALAIIRERGLVPTETTYDILREAQVIVDAKLAAERAESQDEA